MYGNELDSSFVVPEGDVRLDQFVGRISDSASGKISGNNNEANTTT
jgi:hypothetical protein